MIGARAGLTVAAGMAAASAQAEQLRPAPDYVVDMFAVTYEAETLAAWCPDVAVRSVIVAGAWQSVEARLETDGFDMSRDDRGMVDPTPQIEARVQSWADRHGLTEASRTQDVCAAARLEMQQGTTVGGLLQEVGG